MKIRAAVNTGSLTGGFIILLVLCLSTLASAQEADTWQNEITIYGWYAGIGGDVQFPGDSEADFSVDASDILENLSMIFMGGYEGRYNRWAMIVDAIYMDVGDSGSVGSDTVSTNLDLQSWVISGGVGYDVVQSDQGILSVVGGVRYLGLDVDVKLDVLGSSIKENSDSEGILDGVIGLRGYVKLGEKWFLPYYADIGAGGSDLTYQLYGAIGYRFGWGDIRLGYRYLAYELGDGKVMADLNLSGPLLGVGFRF